MRFGLVMADRDQSASVAKNPDRQRKVFRDPLAFAAGFMLLGAVAAQAQSQNQHSASFENSEGLKATYTTSFSVVPATTPTDIFALHASTTKTVRILHVELVCSGANVLEYYTVALHSTQDSGGTSSAGTAVAHDQNLDASATASSLIFTANPTVGNVIGTVRAWRGVENSNSNPSNVYASDFTVRNDQAVVLDKNSTQELAISLNGGTAPSNCSGAVDWSEE